MTKHDEQKEPSLVEQHAMDRLHKVEKEKRRVYVKKPHPLRFRQILMVIILLIVLVKMVRPLVLTALLLVSLRHQSKNMFFRKLVPAVSHPLRWE